MAKVTLILEDHVDEDGQEGLIIDYEPDTDHDENSLAHAYAAHFVRHIMDQAKTAEITDKGEAKPIRTDKEDSELN